MVRRATLWPPGPLRPKCTRTGIAGLQGVLNSGCTVQHPVTSQLDPPAYSTKRCGRTSTSTNGFHGRRTFWNLTQVNIVADQGILLGLDTKCSASTPSLANTNLRGPSFLTNQHPTTMTCGEPGTSPVTMYGEQPRSET